MFLIQWLKGSTQMYNYMRSLLYAGNPFVDPTTVLFPSNLTGVVGPNGCGKSNVIDAVRWVMGELSARHLRGDSMTDVIFNGSSARKPVGNASVELIFDNSDGKISGAYASYGVVTSYYLGVFMTLPYRLGAYRFEARRLYTNRPPCGPKRGHGRVPAAA